MDKSFWYGIAVHQLVNWDTTGACSVETEWFHDSLVNGKGLDFNFGDGFGIWWGDVGGK